MEEPNQPPTPTAASANPLPSETVQYMANLQAQLAQARSEVENLKQRMQREKKIPTPSRKFDGKGDWRDHVFEISKEAILHRITTDERRFGDFLVTSLTGDAARFARALSEKGNLPNTFKEVCEVFEKTYGRSGEETAAEGKLKLLRQMNDGNRFNAQFNILATQAGWDLGTNQTRTRYIGCLSTQVREIVTISPEYSKMQLSNLQGAVEELITKLAQNHLLKSGKKIYWEFPATTASTGKRKADTDKDKSKEVAAMNKESKKRIDVRRKWNVTSAGRRVTMRATVGTRLHE
jgi:hypothetical protein